MNHKKNHAVARLADVASRAGVSQTAASFALSSGPRSKKVSRRTRELVVSAAKELNYLPNQVAQALRRQRTGTVGIIFPDFYADWAQRVMEGLDRALDPHGIVPLIARDSWNPQRQRQEILSLVGRQVDGLILAAPMAENMSLLSDTQGKGTPILFFGETPTGRNTFSYVVWNEGKAVELATRYLFESGRRRVWFVNPGSVATEHLAQSRARVSAFERTAKKIRQSSEFNSLVIHFSSGSAVGENIADMLAGGTHPKPDAILACNDLLGRQIMESLLGRGVKIPDELAVMGLCNHPISASRSVSLSSVHQPLEEMAFVAGESMMNLIARPNSGRVAVMLDAEKLCVRNSTAVVGSGSQSVAGEDSDIHTNYENGPSAAASDSNGAPKK